LTFMQATRSLTRPYVIAWVFSLVFYFLAYAIRSSPAVMIPELAQAFGVSAGGVGTILGTYYYAYALTGLIAGFALDRLGPKHAVPAGVGVLALGCLLFAIPDSLAGNAGRLVQGAGSAFAFIGAVYLASHAFSTGSLATAIGATQCLGMLGGSVGQSAVGPLLRQGLGVHTFWLTMGGANLLIGLGLLFIIPAEPKVELQPNAELPASLGATLRIVFSNPQSYLCGLVAGLLFAPTTLFAMTWGVAFLQHDWQVSYADATWACSMVPLGWVVGCPLLGWAADHAGRKPVLLGGAGLMLLTFGQFVLLPGWLPLPISLFLFGVASGVAMIPYSIIKEVNPDQVKGSATGAMNFLTFGVTALVGPLFGQWFGQGLATAPDPAAHFRTAGLFWLVGIGLAIIGSLFLRETGHKQVTQIAMPAVVLPPAVIA
jgi:MFS family permease